MKKRGFSILEILIYLGLFGILMSSVIATVFSLSVSSDKNIASVGIQEEGTFINRKMSWALSGATSVTGVSSTSISIVRPDLGAQSPLVLSAVGNEMVLSRGGTAPIPLSASRYDVNNAQFVVTPGAGGVPSSVKLTYLIEDSPFIYKTYLRI
jgi:type II secretory pathway pseudopilin PulG